MPEHPMVERIPCFYYSDSADFENLRTYLAKFTRTAPTRNRDGSVYYYSGSGMYSTLQPGQWLVRLSVPYTPEQMQEGYGPKPTWPAGFPEEAPADEA